MLKTLNFLWHKAFLEARSSIALGFFRITLAITVGTHVIPTLLPFADNYLPAAFKEKNFNFFPLAILAWVEASPVWLIYLMAGFFCLFWFCFFIGFYSQWSCILMTAAAYYFYALNSLHVGTLSWDILLVTVFLMCLTGYPGDHFSVDAWWRRKRKGITAPDRPFFIQRLLQCQLAWTYFYTALCKVYPGNWLSENPYYYLMNNPPGGVVRDFWLRSELALRPELCYFLGIAVITAEFLISIFLFVPRIRYAAIFAGIGFHILLLVTLHVPSLFFFHFVPQFLLFIPPEKWLRVKEEGFPGICTFFSNKS